MEMLKLALDARVPFIAVKTDDPLYASDVLSFLSESEAVPFHPVPLPEDWTDFELPSEDVLFTTISLESKELYFKLAQHKKTLVFLNPPKPSIFHFNGGVMLPPKAMTFKVLQGVFEDDEEAKSVLSAFGGLTLKDVRELIQLTLKEFGEVTAKGVNIVRQNYVTKLKGVVQVDTTLDYYDCPHQLQMWLNSNVYFFENDVHPSLRPRGLLFDGTPGTGKTAAAKAIANTLGMPLFRLDIGSMKGKYVGDSEGNLQAALHTVDQMSPCVVIFDEIEKMFGDTHDSGVTSSMLSSLLWWLQEHETKVFTVMTTNNAKSIPVELWREGRIDKKMDFKGLENQDQAAKFAEQQLIAVTQKLQMENVGDLIDTVKKTLKTAQLPIPQVKVLNMVNAAVKEAYLQETK